MRDCLLITGPVNSGKTTLLRRKVKEASDSGKTVGGILSASIYQQGVKQGFDLMDIRTGEMVPLVRTIEKERRLTMSQVQTVGRFILLKSGIAFGTESLSEAAGAGKRGFEKTDIICIDEIGPLEMEGGGYREVLELLIHRYEGRLWIVVRSECLEWIREKCLACTWNIESIQPEERTGYVAGNRFSG